MKIDEEPKRYETRLGYVRSKKDNKYYKIYGIWDTHCNCFVDFNHAKPTGKILAHEPNTTYQIRFAQIDQHKRFLDYWNTLDLSYQADVADYLTH